MNLRKKYLLKMIMPMLLVIVFFSQSNVVYADQILWGHVYSDDYVLMRMEKVMWTKEDATFYSFDDGSIFLEHVAGGLPVQTVALVMTDPYIVITLDGQYLIVRSTDLSSTLESEKATGWTQETVYAALMALKETKYPQGMVLEESQDYVLINMEYAAEISSTRGYFQEKFYYTLYKEIFGEDVVLYRGTNFGGTDITAASDIKVGDYLYIANEFDYMIVLRVDGDTVTGLHVTDILDEQGEGVGIAYLDWDYHASLGEIIDMKWYSIADPYGWAPGLQFRTAY